MSTDERPLVTYALFGYNQEGFAQEAIDAALAQTGTPLQIIMSDDCSADSTFALMASAAEAYDGPHEIVLNRNSTNLGIGGHVNRVMELVRGEFVVAAACDDVSVPHRSETITKAWLASGKVAKSIHSAFIEYDEDGRDLELIPHPSPEKLNDPLLVARTGMYLLGATHAWSPELFDRFGPLMPGLVNEDVALTLRAAMLGRVAYLDEPLVRYRVGQCTWHDYALPTDNVDVIRQRSAKMMRLELKNATQANIDAHTLGDRRLIQVTEGRVMEAKLFVRITAGERLGIADIVAAIRAGARPKQIAKRLLHFWTPRLYERLEEFVVRKTS